MRFESEIRIVYGFGYLSVKGQLYQKICGYDLSWREEKNLLLQLKRNANSGQRLGTHDRVLSLLLETVLETLQMGPGDRHMNYERSYVLNKYFMGPLTDLEIEKQSDPIIQMLL